MHTHTLTSAVARARAEEIERTAAAAVVLRVDSRRPRPRRWTIHIRPRLAIARLSAAGDGYSDPAAATGPSASS